MNVLRRAVNALFRSTFAATAQGADRFVSAAAGFSMDKPTGWTVVSNRPDADESAEELQTALAQNIRVPLVTMTNDRLPLSNFQVSLIARNEALAQASPRQILELRILPLLQNTSPGFALASPVLERELSGHPAAEYVATDTVRAGGASMPVRLRAILIAHPRFFFLIDLLVPADAKLDEAFEKIVSSITLEK